MATTDEALPKLDMRLDWTGVDAAEERIEQMREGGLSGYALTVATMELFGRGLEEYNPGFKKRCFVYIAYFGIDGLASFVKVGISNNPAFRMTGLATGNPLDCLWVFAAKFQTRKDASRTERAIHAHLRDRHRRGEWFSVDGFDEATARQHALGIKETIIGPSAGLFEVRE